MVGERGARLVGSWHEPLGPGALLFRSPGGDGGFFARGGLAAVGWDGWEEHGLAGEGAARVVCAG